MTVTGITIAAAWMAGLAIVALIATGWRKPARATANPARARRPMRSPTGLHVRDSASLHYPDVRNRPVRWWRRLWSLMASSVLAVWIGAVTATVIGFGAAMLVIKLTDMLRR